MKTFADRLRELKARDKVSQAQLIRDLKLGKKTLYNYEHGERTPPLETVVSIADYFSVSIDYLVGRSDDPRRLP